MLTPAGTPFTVGGVTYTATQNYIAGQTTPGYNNVRAVFFPFNSPPPVRLDATIETSPSHDMLGFLLGALDASFPYIDITVYTNTASYFFPVQPVPTTDTALQFFGFVATRGESLTEFTLQAGQNPGSTPAITDIEIGNASAVTNPVPEPASLALLSTGIVGVMGALRKRLRLILQSRCTDEARATSCFFPLHECWPAPSAHLQSGRGRPAIPQGGELAGTRSFISGDTPLASGNPAGAAAAEQGDAGL